MRPRHYVSRSTYLLAAPLFRYSVTRDARVLRFVGDTHGPVLKIDRRRHLRAAREPFDGAERRSTAAA